MAIEIRLLRDTEKEIANSFFNRIYNANRSMENFTWEFFNAPAGKAIYVVAIDNAETQGLKVVGIQCAIPIQLVSSKGQTILTAKSEDTLVDPAYRGQKIFEKMYDVLFEACRTAGVKYIWGFTPAEKAFSRLGFAIPFKTKQALAAFNITKAYEYLSKLNPGNTTKDKAKILALCTLSWFKGKTSFARPGKEYSIQKSDFTRLNKYFFEFYAAASLYNLGLSADFVKWRIQDNPNENVYRHLEVSYKGEVVASVVVNHRSDVSYIEQILTKSDEYLKPVIQLVVREMLKEKPALIRLLCFDNNTHLAAQYTQLGQAGFTTLSRGSFFVWKDLDGNILDPKDLFLTRLFTQGNL